MRGFNSKQKLLPIRIDDLDLDDGQKSLLFSDAETMLEARTSFDLGLELFLNDLLQLTFSIQVVLLTTVGI